MIEDFEPYPCYPRPVFVDILPPVLEPPEIVPVELELEPLPELELAVDGKPANNSRRKRSLYFHGNDKKDDVYSIFKVKYL